MGVGLFLGPSEPQDSPKKPQESPSEPQESPREPQESPREPHESPKTTPECPKRAQRKPKRAPSLKIPKITHQVYDLYTKNHMILLSGGNGKASKKA